MLTPIVAKLLELLEAFLDYFVQASVMWTHSEGEQWVLVHYESCVTNKGVNVLDAVVTIIHSGLDFLAQMLTLLPAEAGLYYPPGPPGTCP